MVSLGRLSRPFFCCRHARTLRAASAGTSPGRRPDAWCSLTLRPGLKGMRGWLAAARLRLYPHSAPAGAPAGRARSGGSPLPRAGRHVAPGCSPLRLRGCCASLRPRSPLRSAARPSAPARALRGSRLCPCARWAALSLSPVAPVPPLRPRCARSPVSRPPTRPALPATLSPPALPRGGAARPAAAGCLVGVPPPRVLSGGCGRRGVPRLRARGVPPAAAGGKRWDFDFPLPLKIPSP